VEYGEIEFQVEFCETKIEYLIDDVKLAGNEPRDSGTQGTHRYQTEWLKV